MQRTALNKHALAALIALAGTASIATASPLVDGVLDAEYGAPVKVYTDNYVNGTDASSGTNVISTYFTHDASYVYGVVQLDSGPKAFNGANVYVYSSTPNVHNITGLPGVYGDGNDVLAEGANGWGFASPSGMIGAPVAYNPATVNYVYNGTTDTVEFSIARSLLGDYSTFRYGGQFFGYEFHTGGDRVDGAIVAVPEPATLGLAAIAGLALVARRRRAAV